MRLKRKRNCGPMQLMMFGVVLFLCITFVSYVTIELGSLPNGGRQFVWKPWYKKYGAIPFKRRVQQANAIIPLGADGRLEESCLLAMEVPPFVCDSDGRVCSIEEVDRTFAMPRCCPATSPRFSCFECHSAYKCCKDYAVCVSCCMSKALDFTDHMLFLRCSEVCRTSSKSLASDGKFLESLHRFCYE